MRYTKAALLTFGVGLVLALVIVAAELDSLQRVASAVMALGVAGLPIGMAVDWRRATKTRSRPSARRGRSRTRRTAPGTRRRMGPRKPVPKRR